MTHYLIIEDEKLTAQRLAAMLERQIPNGKLLAVLDSVSAAVRWLSQNPHPQLAFFDIQLADGLSFEIFEQITVDFPVIFTTAFNEYAIKAFKVNSIDYLLKPIDEQELARAVEKFNKTTTPITPAIDASAIANALQMLNTNYKTRFLVKVGEHIRMVPVEEITLFYSAEKATFVSTTAGRNYAIDQTLDQISTLVNPSQFFRVSRKHIVALSAIADIIAYSGSRLKLKLSVSTDDDILVSREKVAEFKGWLDR